MIRAEPSIFFKPKNIKTEYELKNSLAAAIHVTSPLNFELSRCVRSKIHKKLIVSRLHNKANLSVIKLSPSVSKEGCFYALDKSSAISEQLKEVDLLKEWKSCENFSVVWQKDNTHQLFVCSMTNEGSHKYTTIAKLILFCEKCFWYLVVKIEVANCQFVKTTFYHFLIKWFVYSEMLLGGILRWVLLCHTIEKNSWASFLANVLNHKKYIFWTNIWSQY